MHQLYTIQLFFLALKGFKVKKKINDPTQFQYYLKYLTIMFFSKTGEQCCSIKPIYNILYIILN